VSDQRQPIESIRYWLDAYRDPASGPHFMGHGRVVQMLAEYLAMREHEAMFRDYHCTLKCAACGHKNYFTMAEMELTAAAAKRAG